MIADKNLEQQKQLLLDIATKVIGENPKGSYLIYTTYHGNGGDSDADLLGESMQAMLLQTPNDVDGYLEKRVHNYQPEHGLMIDIARCFKDDSVGIDWVQVGFKKASINELSISSEDSSRKTFNIERYDQSKFSEIKGLLENSCFPESYMMKKWES